MTRQKALALAKKKFGPTAFLREDKRTHWNGFALPRTQADRDDYRVMRDTLRIAEPKWKPLEQWDGDTPLHVYRDALAKYNAEKKVWREQLDASQSLSHYHRYSVAITVGIFTETKGHGDTWEDALKAAGITL